MKLNDILNHIKNKPHPVKEDSSNVPEEEDFTLELSDGGDIYKNGRFLNSVEQLSEEDIDMPAPTAVKKEKTLKDLPRQLLLLLFSAAFLVSCGFLVKSLISKYRAVEIYNQLEAEFFSAGFDFNFHNNETPDDGEITLLSPDKGLSSLKSWTVLMTNTPEDPDDPEHGDDEKKEYNEELEKMRAGLTSLAKINPDIYGWITVEDTRINYPICQGTDNDYYLNHAYTGAYLPEGSIFADYRNLPSVAENYNTVFYGHNLTSGGMFHDVAKFAKEEYMMGKLIYVYTFEGVFIYEPFSFYESRFDYNYFKTNFSGEDAFIAFAEEVQQNSAAVEKNLTFTGDDRLLTLSTCTNGYYTQRYALHAKLIKVITD